MILTKTPTSSHVVSFWSVGPKSGSKLVKTGLFPYVLGKSMANILARNGYYVFLNGHIRDFLFVPCFCGIFCRRGNARISIIVIKNYREITEERAHQKF